ncbi:MAG: hypothetical protein ABI602_01790 [Candidatus Saccharibacteria bacterium]
MAAHVTVPAPNSNKLRRATGLRGPAYCLGLGLLLLAWAACTAYRLSAAGGLSSVVGFLVMPLLLFTGTVITLPAALILIKRLIQKKVA